MSGRRTTPADRKTAEERRGRAQRTAPDGGKEEKGEQPEGETQRRAEGQERRKRPAEGAIGGNSRGGVCHGEPAPRHGDIGSPLDYPGDVPPQRSPVASDTSPSKAYLKQWEVAFAEQHRLTERWLAAVTSEREIDPMWTARLLRHVATCGLLPAYEHGWVPVPAHLLRREFGLVRTEDVWRPLVRAGLLEHRPYDRAGRHCREFRLPPDLLDTFAAAQPDPEAELVPTSRVDLFTGRPTRRSPRTRLTDEHGHPLPELTREAIAVLTETGCTFDRRRVLAHLRARSTALRAAVTAWRVGGEPEEGPAFHTLLRVRSRANVDTYAYSRVRLHGTPRRVDGDLYRYTPAYLPPQSGGRLTEAGGFQSCSNAMKGAAFGTVEGAANYDMDKAHPRGLIQLFEREGVDAGWLRAYITGDSGDYAEEAFGARGEPEVGLFKKCVLALFNAAALPETVEVPEPIRGGPRRGRPRSSRRSPDTSSQHTLNPKRLLLGSPRSARSLGRSRRLVRNGSPTSHRGDGSLSTPTTDAAGGTSRTRRGRG